MAKLPPIDFQEDIEKFEAFQETTKVKFKGCKHKNTKIVDGELRCQCGAAWIGNIEKLKEILDRG